MPLVLVSVGFLVVEAILQAHTELYKSAPTVLLFVEAVSFFLCVLVMVISLPPFRRTIARRLAQLWSQ